MITHANWLKDLPRNFIEKVLQIKQPNKHALICVVSNTMQTEFSVQEETKYIGFASIM